MEINGAKWEAMEEMILVRIYMCVRKLMIALLHQRNRKLAFSQIKLNDKGKTRNILTMYTKDYKCGCLDFC